MPEILLTDALNFNKRNYASLFKCGRSIETFVPANNHILRILDFNVDQFPEENIANDTAIEWLKNGTIEIRRLSIKPSEVAQEFIRQYLVAYDDELKFCLTPVTYKSQVDKLSTHSTFLKNTYLTMKYWEEYFNKNYSKILSSKAVIVFGGTSILASIMLATCKRIGKSTLLSEHFVTGTEYYLEYRFSPIPNASYAGRLFSSLPETDEIEDKKRAIAKFDGNNNKNVKRVTNIDSGSIIKSDYILFVAQVPSDASLSAIQSFYSPIAKLLETVEWLLDNTEQKIVIKWHPWELNKISDPSCLSRTVVSAKLASREDEERVIHIEHCNLVHLAKHATAVVTICSQAAIELAIYNGTRTITLERPFYSFMGCNKNVQNISEIDFNKFDSILSINEYEAFLTRLTWFVQKYLISVHPSGQRRLKAIFAEVLDRNRPPLAPKRHAPTSPEQPLVDTSHTYQPKDILDDERFKIWEFENLLRYHPERIVIPEQHRLARFLQHKRWAKPIWFLLAVPSWHYWRNRISKA